MRVRNPSSLRAGTTRQSPGETGIGCASVVCVVATSAHASMQAVATAAGVGKGTVFHRFGDRDGLTQALLDDYMRDFQDAFLHGPPPLGPGAPPDERLAAFVVELV